MPTMGHVHLGGQLLGVGAVHKAGVHFAAGYIVQHLPHAVAQNKLGLQSVPQFCCGQRGLV